jgi:N-acetyl-alpha-D-glucosaminyl L-malate synthase BshA
MNIGIVCYPTYGGSGVVATELGKGLALRGHNVHFLSYARPYRLADFQSNVFYHEVSINAYPLFEFPPYDLALASHMVDLIQHQNLDLLHVHYAIPHATSAFLAKQILGDKAKHVPIVTTLHGTDITIVGKDSSYIPVVTFSINQSDGVTAVSDYLKKETFEHFDITKEIEVIPNFVDLERFSRREVGHFKRAICPNDEKLLVHVSNFRKVKRVGDCVHILKGVLDRGIKAKLLLAGDGPERQHVEELCRELGTCNQVRFLGKLEKVEEILSLADVFLLPSGSETFGLAALEAMSCGVPVVSSNIGGIPELNIHGETGYLADLADISTMTEQTIALLTDDNLHARMSKNARARAEMFELDNIVGKYEAYYEKVMAGMGVRTGATI